MNLLQNPNFSGPYTSRSRGNEIVAANWHEFYRNEAIPPHEPSQGPTGLPEYKPVYKRDFPYRVQYGDAAQCFFSFHRVMDAGVLQRVDVETGRWLRFRANVQAWCSNGDDPRKSEREMYVSLGIGVHSDPFELGAIWTPWQYIGAEYVMLTSPAVQAWSRQTFVAVRAWNKWKSKHADLYVDYAELTYVDIGGTPEPEPEPEPGACDALSYDLTVRAVKQGVSEFLRDLTGAQ